MGKQCKYCGHVRHPTTQYPNDICVICDNGITLEHGGIGCINCGSDFCCSEICIPKKYLIERSCYSHSIPACNQCTVEDNKFCPRCNYKLGRFETGKQKGKLWCYNCKEIPNKEMLPFLTRPLN